MPIDFYRLFISKEIVKYMQVETNRYATQVIEQKRPANIPLSPRSQFSTWKPVSLQEMTRVLAILSHMGIVKKPPIVDYWSTHPVLQTCFASKLMKRERFRAILSFFHLNDNTTYVPRQRPDHDPLHKLRPLFELLVQVSYIFYSFS